MVHLKKTFHLYYLSFVGRGRVFIRLGSLRTVGSQLTAGRATAAKGLRGHGQHRYAGRMRKVRSWVQIQIYLVDTDHTGRLVILFILMNFKIEFRVRAAEGEVMGSNPNLSSSYC